VLRQAGGSASVIAGYYGVPKHTAYGRIRNARKKAAPARLNGDVRVLSHPGLHHSRGGSQATNTISFRRADLAAPIRSSAPGKAPDRRTRWV